MENQFTPEVSHHQLVNGKPMWDTTARGTCTSTPHAPKRQRGPKRKLGLGTKEELEHRRQAANISERRRQRAMNEALDDLRACLPQDGVFSDQGRLTKLATLQLAATYIAALTDMLREGEEVRDVERHALIGNQRVPQYPEVEEREYPVQYPAVTTPRFSKMPELHTPVCYSPEAALPAHGWPVYGGYTPTPQTYFGYSSAPMFVPVIPPPTQEHMNYMPWTPVDLRKSVSMILNKNKVEYSKTSEIVSKD